LNKKLYNWQTPHFKLHFYRAMHFSAKLVVDLSVRDTQSQNAAEWLQIAQRRAHRKPPSFFWIVSSLPPTTSPSPKLGFHMPKIREWPYHRNGWSDTLHVWF